tara:strand:+ start:304 stop:1317 length:1014 start_codon:yes stop_codon:yes gene_type:complete
MQKKIYPSLYYFILIGYCLLFSYSLYVYEPELNAKPQKNIELTEEQKLENKIKEVNLRLKEAEEAEVKLRIEQQKFESIKSEALNLQEKAEKLYTEEKKKKFEQRIYFFIILFTLILIIGLSFFIYRMFVFRNVANGNLEQLPEQTYIETKDRMIKLGENFAKLAGYLNSLGEDVNSYANKSSISSKDNDVKINELLTRFTELSKRIDEKDNEISRLKDGYDNQIKVSVLKDFLIIRDRIIIRIDENKGNDKIITLLENLLTITDQRIEEQGLKKLIFNPGQNWRDIDGAEPLEQLDTDNENDKGKVIETIEHGYYLDGLDGNKIVVKKALIKLYRG